MWKYIKGVTVKSKSFYYFACGLKVPINSSTEYNIAHISIIVMARLELQNFSFVEGNIAVLGMTFRPV